MHFEQGYVIYDNYFAKLGTMKSVETAQVGLQIANILEEQNRINEASSYVQEALEIYRAVYGEASDNAIIA